MRPPWNHNVHYYDLIVRAVPSLCGSALDVGCGSGLLTRLLAPYCREITGIDRDADALARARTAAQECCAAPDSIQFIGGDILEHPLPEATFDFIAAAAVLHHLPLQPALGRFSALLKPGGVLAILGLYRAEGLYDHLWSAATLPVSWSLRAWHGHTDVAAPVREPEQTLAEIRASCAMLLPGSCLRRCLLFRYFLTWRKP